MRHDGWPPHATEKPRDYAILLERRHAPERRSWLTPLEQQRTAAIICFKEPHGRITIPEPKARNLVLALHVRHGDLQHGVRPAGEHHRRHPGAAHLVAVEWNAEPERPSSFQIAYDIRKSSEPCRALWRFEACGCQPRRDIQCHVPSCVAELVSNPMMTDAITRAGRTIYGTSRAANFTGARSLRLPAGVHLVLWIRFL
jgi:hypothetical protein